MSIPSLVTIEANLHKDSAVSVAGEITTRLRGAGITVRHAADLALALGETPFAGSVFDDAELHLCLGGDGTLLHAVRDLNGRRVPILGINLGGLGFLTAVPPDEIDACCRAIAAGEYRVEERSMVHATARGPHGEQVDLHALNEIVIDEGTFTRRAVVLKLDINDIYVGTFTADGLIVATPTGSTAYGLSAGGPIVNPTLDAFVVTPICAHALSVRPLVFGADEEVVVENLLPDATLKLTADGQDAQQVAPGSAVRIGRSERTVPLAFVGPRPYYEILRTKLNWGGIAKER